MGQSKASRPTRISTLPVRDSAGDPNVVTPVQEGKSSRRRLGKVGKHEEWLAAG
jgi:hypothetical protein